MLSVTDFVFKNFPLLRTQRMHPFLRHHGNIHLMKKPVSILLLAIASLWATYLPSQSTLSGIINHYTEVGGIDTCQSSLTVTDTSGFMSGMQVLIIQMQGALVNQTNTSAFGSINSLGGAGWFERSQLDTIIGSQFYFRKKFLHAYQVAGAVQVVSFPAFAEATVGDTLSPKSWDGKTGGVLALEVSGQLTLNAPIDASGSGFRGGQSLSWPNGCLGGFNSANDYFYPANSWRGAEKGEGVAKKVTGRESGKGAWANGGGGGNDHNSGGAGGGGIAAGGDGGERDSPLISGDCRGEHPGLGGKLLASQQDLVFMGGGGGAGHSNNDVGSDGGHGGGIVILLAGKMAGRDQVILADGRHAANTRGGDGAGGGGAGGSILLQVDEPSGQLRVFARGGNGGSVNNNSDNCFGPGGGGAGGWIRTNRASFLSYHTPGQPGRTTNSSRPCNNSTNGADAGQTGILSESFLLPESNLAQAPAAITQAPPASLTICESENASLTVVVTGKGLRYRWQVDSGSGFLQLSDGAQYSGTQTSTLTIRTVSTSSDGLRFRVQILADCGQSLLSSATTLYVQLKPVAAFNFQQNGGTLLLQNSSSYATTYRWDFGDGSTSTLSDPTHTYLADGTYRVRLTAKNDCGEATFEQTLTITTLPVAAFSADVQTGCVPFVVRFQNLSSPNATSWRWEFPGGMPATSTDKNPIVTYQRPGLNDVVLTATNSAGSDRQETTYFIEAQAQPVAAFDWASNDRTVQFTNRSSGATTLRWAFGDGDTSKLENPIHTYQVPGRYAVTLTATNRCGSVTFTDTVTLGRPPVAGFTASSLGGCAPVKIKFQERTSGMAKAWFWIFDGGDPYISVLSALEVWYRYPGKFDVALAAINEIGSDTLLMPDFISIAPRPVADFTFSVSGRAVSFQNHSRDADRYLWDFGDGTPVSADPHPVHTYRSDGSYSVTLNALNSQCSQGITYQVGIVTSATGEPLSENWPRVSPSLFFDIVQVELGTELAANGTTIQVFDPAGKLIFSTFRQNSPHINLDLQNLTSGMYVLKIESATGSSVHKILKLFRP
jgi:PKD repeat protein